MKYYYYYSVLCFAVAGHLDTRKSIQRVVALTFTISFAYSLTQVSYTVIALNSNLSLVCVTGHNAKCGVNGWSRMTFSRFW